MANEAKHETEKSPKRHLETLKTSGYKPWRVVFSYIIFIGLFVLIPVTPRFFLHPVHWAIGLYLLFMAGATAIEVVQGRIPLKPGPIFHSFVNKLAITIFEMLIMVLVLPLMALQFLAGPVMLFLFMGSIVGIAEYVIQGIIGYDIKGVVQVFNGTHALLAIPVAILSFWAMLHFLKVCEIIDKMMEKTAGLIVYLYKGKKPKEK